MVTVDLNEQIGNTEEIPASDPGVNITKSAES
jgi:hypothetical protein